MQFFFKLLLHQLTSMKRHKCLSPATVLPLPFYIRAVPHMCPVQKRTCLFNGITLMIYHLHCIQCMSRSKVWQHYSRSLLDMSYCMRVCAQGCSNQSINVSSFTIQTSMLQMYTHAQRFCRLHILDWYLYQLCPVILCYS